MLGQATIEEKYKENIKDTVFVLSKCNENLAFENQLLFSGPDGAKKFRDPLKLDLDELNNNNNSSREPVLTCCPEEAGWSAAQPWAWCFCRGHVSVSHCAREPDPRALGMGEIPRESAQTTSDATETAPVGFRVAPVLGPVSGVSLPGLGGPGISGTTWPFPGQVSALQSQNTEER